MHYCFVLAYIRFGIVHMYIIGFTNVQYMDIIG